jgi:hypothetical protein
VSEWVEGQGAADIDGLAAVIAPGFPGPGRAQ